MPKRTEWDLSYQPLTKRMLVCRIGRVAPHLVTPERGAQETGLPKQPLSSAIDVSLWLELSREDALEIAHRRIPAVEIVVEAEHLYEQSWSQLKGRADRRRNHVSS